MECQNVITVQMVQTRDKKKTLFHDDIRGFFIVWMSQGADFIIFTLVLPN